MTPLLALLAIALLLVPLAGAAETEEDVAWRTEPRSLDVRGHLAGFTFTSARDSALGADSLSGGFDAPSAHLTTALLATRPEPNGIRLDVAWTGLAEYRDTDGDGLYGLADETVQSIAVPGLPQQTVVAPALAGGDVVTVTYALPRNESQADPVIGGGLPGSQGTLRLAFTLVSTPATVDGRLLRPTEVGLDAEVRDFPFQAGDTRLALVAEVTTDAASLDPADTGVSAAAGRNSWQATWTPRARVDGAEAIAGWSSLASDTSQATAVLSLPRGEAVSQQGSVSAHRMGEEVVVALRDLPPGDWRFYAVGLAGAALALGVPSLRRLKER